MSDAVEAARSVLKTFEAARRDGWPNHDLNLELICRALLAAVEGSALTPRDERAVTDNGRDAVIEECAEVAHTHREKGPWYGTELVVWRRACAQVEDAIRALSQAKG